LLPVAASFESAPYSEFAKLVLKVSHNLGADTSAMMIGVERAAPHFFFAMDEFGKVLTDELGLNPDSFAFTDASGSRSFATPRTVMQLLKEVRRRPYFDEFRHGLPILGVDGSLAVVQEGGPATGQVFGKTGTGAMVDFAHLRPFLTEKALGGYIDSDQGREVAYCYYVQNGLITNSIFEPLTDVIEINEDIGEIATILWSGRY
jgi:D-alanyl-D-alanine carboxypeptidase/D-alanyl-D-alanine-endopeptidase (penicillin-binding protein 4)